MAMEIRLDLDGMHCASCAARIEKQLNRLHGVQATVNLATEQATVQCLPEVGVDDLLAAVDAAGYHAHVVSRSSTTIPSTSCSAAWRSRSR